MLPMLGDYRWSVKRDKPFATHSRRLLNRKFMAGI